MICMAMYGSGVKIGMMKIKNLKSFGAVRGSMLPVTPAPLTVGGSVPLIGSSIWVFVSSELYLLDLVFFTLGIFTFFFLRKCCLILNTDDAEASFPKMTRKCDFSRTKG